MEDDESMVTSITRVLSYLGLMPLVMALIMRFISPDQAVMMASWIETYLFMIVVFLAGAQWGLHLRNESSQFQSKCIAVISIGLALSAWVMFQVYDHHGYLNYVLGLLIALCGADYYLMKSKWITLDYFKLRGMITLCLIFLMVCWMLI
tara:strand:+ start:75 stop:521 length:447 start_codon:yes stop_codon:yes gene_type:complete